MKTAASAFVFTALALTVPAIFFSGCSGGSNDSRSGLTPEEESVIVNKGTEKPFTGKYNDNYEHGTYLCRRCRAPLYRSDDKFNAGCGWPSFDNEIEGAVRRLPDPDGIRTEITCAACGGHLGHVFTGEGFTHADTRHCVNSVSLTFVPGREQPRHEKIVLGGGCFWCIEAIFEQVEGVEEAVSGYAGGNTGDPTYPEVCTGNTGHAEVVMVGFDPDRISLEELLEIFFRAHDPTSVNRQGNDIGSQYRSIILYSSPEQLEQADRAIQKAGAVHDRPVVTEVKPLDVFYPAEEYHQDYYAKNPDKSYCRQVIAPRLTR